MTATTLPRLAPTIASTIDEMRDLGWGGDADGWEEDARWIAPEDRSDFLVQIRHELAEMIAAL